MINWDKELEKIFSDPLLSDVTAPKRKINSSDRLIAGFQQVIEFVETYNRLPLNCEDRDERRLYNQLQGILNDPEKKIRCKSYDTCNLLDLSDENRIVLEPKTPYPDGSKTEEELLNSIFSDPILDNIGSSGNDLFDLPDYMKQRLKERQEADYVAKKVKCEDFNVFEEGFKEVHKGLKSGKYRLIKFKEAHVSQGRYFLEDGILVYIASLERKEKNRHRRNDSRTRCIYENGMESGIYMQTLCKNLYSSGYSVLDTSPDDDYLNKIFSVANDDVESGLIYVLRSLSKDPEITAIPNLYKIGFTTIPLKVRIANAKNEPTYLCSDVEVIATWRVYNVKSSVFEALIHKLFDSVRLQVNIDGKTPKEWFVVPFPIIEQAIKYIISGKPVAYDKEIQQLIYLDDLHRDDFPY